MPCPRCQLENRPQATFCEACGMPLTANPSSPPAPLYAEITSALSEALESDGRRGFFGKSALGIVAVGLAVMVLSPSLRTGFVSDDSANSLINGVLRYHDLSVGSEILEDCRRWFRDGRFNPFMFVLVRYTFSLLPGLTLYKGYILLHVMLNMACFAYFLWRATGLMALTGLSIPVLTLLFQFRVFHDPILAFHGSLQFVTTCMFLSLIALDRYLTSGGGRWMGVSLLAYLAALLTYEISYPLFLIHLIFIRKSRAGFRATASTGLPYVAAAVSCAGVVLFLRLALGYIPSERYQLNWSLSKFLITFGKQLLAALPLSYYLSGSAELFRTGLPRAASGSALLVVVSSLSLTLLCLNRLRQEPADRVRTALGFLWPFGLLLWTLPAILVSTSPVYQQAITVGLGYLPVYVQYYGVCSLLLCAMVFGLARLSRWPTASTALLLAAGAVVALGNLAVYRANVAVAQHYARERDIRQNLEKSLHAGLLDAVPESATLLLDHDYPLWHIGWPWRSHRRTFSEYFYYLHSGRMFSIVHLSSLANQQANAAEGLGGAGRGSPAPAFEVVDRLTDGGTGYVFAAQLAPAEPGAGPRRFSGLTEEARLFVWDRRWRRRQGRPSVTVVGRYADDAGAAVTLPARQLQVVRRGRDWVIYAFASPGRPILTNSLAATMSGGAAETRAP